MSHAGLVFAICMVIAFDAGTDLITAHSDPEFSTMEDLECLLQDFIGR